MDHKKIKKDDQEGPSPEQIRQLVDPAGVRGHDPPAPRQILQPEAPNQATARCSRAAGSPDPLRLIGA